MFFMKIGIWRSFLAWCEYEDLFASNKD